MSEYDFLKQRYKGYDDQKLLDIITNDLHKYEMIAFNVAEEILSERGYDTDNVIAVFNENMRKSRQAAIEKAEKAEKAEKVFESIDDEIVHRISNGENPEMVVLDMKNRGIAGIRVSDEETSKHLNFTEKENRTWITISIVIAVIFVLLEIFSSFL